METVASLQERAPKIHSQAARIRSLGGERLDEQHPQLEHPWSVYQVLQFRVSGGFNPGSNNLLFRV